MSAFSPVIFTFGRMSQRLAVASSSTNHDDAQYCQLPYKLCVSPSSITEKASLLGNMSSLLVYSSLTRSVRSSSTLPCSAFQHFTYWPITFISSVSVLSSGLLSPSLTISIVRLCFPTATPSSALLIFTVSVCCAVRSYCLVYICLPSTDTFTVSPFTAFMPLLLMLKVTSLLVLSAM